MGCCDDVGTKIAEIWSGWLRMGQSYFWPKWLKALQRHMPTSFGQNLAPPVKDALREAKILITNSKPESKIMYCKE
jgi:hypothetical protein